MSELAFDTDLVSKLAQRKHACSYPVAIPDEVPRVLNV
jgi:hypothetical protein